MAIVFINKVSNPIAFEKKVKEISYKLGIDENWLMFLMDFESGIDSARVNPYGCVGLIQFCKNSSGVDYKTIGGKQYKLSDIKAMTNIDQLDLVYEYLKPYKGDMKTFYDLYFAILWPAALGKSDDYIINTGTNSIFDLNKNGVIAAGEVKQFLNDRVEKLVPEEFKSSFLKKKVSGAMEPVKRNLLQIYQREIILSIIIIILLTVLYSVYKQIIK